MRWTTRRISEKKHDFVPDERPMLGDVVPRRLPMLANRRRVAVQVDEGSVIVLTPSSFFLLVLLLATFYGSSGGGGHGEMVNCGLMQNLSAIASFFFRKKQITLSWRVYINSFLFYFVFIYENYIIRNIGSLEQACIAKSVFIWRFNATIVCCAFLIRDCDRSQKCFQ